MSDDGKMKKDGLWSAMIRQENKMKWLFVAGAVLLLFVYAGFAKACPYYVKNGGSDSASGLSDANAWATIGKVNSTVTTTSCDVYFLAGDTWSGDNLQIDWAGTSGNRAIVGSYYMNPSETVGVPDGTSKPTIYGGFVPNSGSIGNVPSSPYGSLISVQANYVTVQQLRAENSSGFGISISDSITYAVIDDNEVIHSTGAGIGTWKNNDFTTIKDNYIYQSVWSREEGLQDQAYGGSTHPACLRIREGTDKALVEGNTIVECWGEGIGLSKDAEYNIIRANTVIGSRHVSLYINQSRHTVMENNLVIGNGLAAAIGMAVEGNGLKYGSSTDNVVRNNVLVDVQRCITMFIFSGAAAEGQTLSGQFLGNTCAGAEKSVVMSGGASVYTDIEIANNIFWDLSDGAAACSAPTTANVDFHNNSHDTNPTDSDCDGTGDVYGDPNFNYGGDWAAFDASNIPTTADITAQSGSNTENAGFDLDTTILNVVNYPLYTDITNPNSTFDTTELGYDYSGDARHATTPDIGAEEIGASAPTAETVPWGMNMGAAGAIGPLASGRSYEAEQYCTYTGSNYTGSDSDAIDGTTDDALYNSWHGGSGSVSCAIPIDNAATTAVNVEFHMREQFWTCATGVRRFDLLIDGVVVYNEIDPCFIAGVMDKAAIYTEANIDVGADDIVYVGAQIGTTGTSDNKYEIMGFYVTEYTGTGDTLSVVDSAISTTITNSSPDYSIMDIVSQSGATSTEGSISVSSVDTTNITSGTVSIVSGAVVYTPESDTVTGSVGSFVATLDDGVSTEDVTVTLTVQLETGVSFTINDTNGNPVTNLSGLCWAVYRATGDLIQSTEVIRGNNCDGTSDGNGTILVRDSRLAAWEDEAVTVWVRDPINENSSFYGGASDQVTVSR